MILEALAIYCFENFDTQTSIPIAIGVLTVAVFSILMYVVRIKDHVREESRIDDVHFRKVKDYIRDLCDGIESDILIKGSAILSETIKIRTDAVCLTDMSKCFNVQEERWDSDCRRCVDSKLYSKVCGWMRENGFYSWNPKVPDDMVKITDYVETRSNQAVNALNSTLKTKAKIRTPILVSEIDNFFTEERSKEFLMDIVLYTILEMNEAYKEIKEYRISHGFMPSILKRTIMFLAEKKR